MTSVCKMLEQVLVNGNRFYRVQNDQTKVYPSITTVLGSVIAKPELENWQRKVSLLEFKKQLQLCAERRELPGLGTVQILPGERVLEDMVRESMTAPDKICDMALSFGTEVHAIIEKLILTNADDMPCDPEYVTVKDSFRAWRRQVESSGSKIIKTEVQVVSKRYGYAGTMDALLRTVEVPSGKEIWTVLDWKTSNAIRNEYALQVAAYAKAYEEMTGTPIDRAAVVRFNKKGSPTYEVKTVHNLEEAFDAFCSVLHIWQMTNQSLF
ncbi:uncharacterized protein LOC126304981 [Schistocerca gregaria]|uniref:uncharacterized protein LOC126304981 n=1 Tax=Schistocerca gregaria TaxID=7010 RepID=UPI00211DD004|nr:uncharacterized protein LOC126304981 [Schistocerca gregaria]